MYKGVKTRLREDRKKNRKIPREKYASDYQNIINLANEYIAGCRETPKAAKMLRLIAYCYRSLDQHEKILTAAGNLKNTRPELKAAAITVEIPYLLETDQTEKALSAFDELVGLAANTEERQAALYGKARLYLHHLGDEAQARSVLEQIIGLDSNSNLTLLALERISRLDGEPAPPAEPAVSADQGGKTFSAINYPNPANPGTKIVYSLPEEGKVVIKIYNILGYKVAELANHSMPAGDHQVVWDGKDNSGNVAASGLYFYNIRFKDKVISKKFTLLK